MDACTFFGKRILITAGPTREAIDPVRFISNHSTGKMGYAIAEEFLRRGANVWIVSGPVSVKLQHPSLEIIHVSSAAEMYLACYRFFEQADIAVFTAAVADYRPVRVAAHKIKKHDEAFTITLTKNVDIAYEFGKVKTANQLSIGFALETDEEEMHAISKLKRKNFDLIALNSMNDFQAGFGFDTNKITIMGRDGNRKIYPLKAKAEVAEDLVNEIGEALYYTNHISGSERQSSAIVLPSWRVHI